MQKQVLYEHCQALIQQKISTVEAGLREAQAAAHGETKSSAGDKYETGRAMMHLEQEKLASQRANWLQQQQALSQIDPQQTSQVITRGSLVQTDQGCFFIAVGLGQVTADRQTYFVVSPVAPVGQALLQRAVGDTVSINGRSLNILQVL